MRRWNPGPEFAHIGAGGTSPPDTLLAERIGVPRAAVLLRRNAREERGHAEPVRCVLAIQREAIALLGGAEAQVAPRR